jgi:hypothetical protein
MTDMAGTLYLPYLLALLIVPLAVKWRWGLAASLLVTVAELGLVVLLALYVIPTAPYPVEPIQPDESPLLRIRRSQARAYATFIVWTMFPGIAALVGGGLSLVWWGVGLALRTTAGRR